MIKSAVELREVDIYKSKVCDMCGMEASVDDEFEAQEFVKIYQSCGYASIFGDGNEFSIDLCQHCLKKIIDHFEIHTNEEY